MTQPNKFHRKYFQAAAQRILKHKTESSTNYGSPDFWSCSALEYALEDAGIFSSILWLEAYEVATKALNDSRLPKFWNEDPTFKNQTNRAKNLLLVGELLHDKRIPQKEWYEYQDCPYKDTEKMLKVFRDKIRKYVKED